MVKAQLGWLMLADKHTWVRWDKAREPKIFSDHDFVPLPFMADSFLRKSLDA